MKDSGRSAWAPTRAAIRAWKDILCTRSISGTGAKLPRTLMLRYVREHSVYRLNVQAFAETRNLTRTLPADHRLHGPHVVSSHLHLGDELDEQFLPLELLLRQLLYALENLCLGPRPRRGPTLGLLGRPHLTLRRPEEAGPRSVMWFALAPSTLKAHMAEPSEWRSSVEREVMWAPWERPGLEHLRLVTSDGGGVANGWVIGLEAGRPSRIDYEICCDGR